jgi:hypothetical protein
MTKSKLNRVVIHRFDFRIAHENWSLIWKNDLKKANVFWLPNGRPICREVNLSCLFYNVGSSTVNASYKTGENRLMVIWYKKTW